MSTRKILNQLHEHILGRRKNFIGQHFWARGYHVSTVGEDKAMIRKYIRHQESEDQRIDQFSFFSIK